MTCERNPNVDARSDLVLCGKLYERSEWILEGVEYPPNDLRSMARQYGSV